MNTKANTTVTTKTVIEPKTETKIQEPVQSLPEQRLREVDNIAVWTVLGIEGCPWTEKAVALLKEHRENYKLVFINREWQRKLIVQYNCRRSPAIFRGVQYMGSYADLENYYKCWFFSDSELF